MEKSSLFEIFHRIKRPSGKHLFSQARRVQFGYAVPQVIVLIHIQSADGGAVDAEHDTGFAGRVTGPVDAVV